MRRSGIIHADLAAAVTRLRHTETFAISDSGLPSGPGVPVVDLGVSYGLPPFLTVLDLVLAEVEVEAAWGSEDVLAANPEVHTRLDRLPNLTLVEHEDFKARIADCRFVVRTGEATPFANVILRAGVPWLP